MVELLRIIRRVTEGSMSNFVGTLIKRCEQNEVLLTWVSLKRAESNIKTYDERGMKTKVFEITSV
jgi:hypothetical protein